MAFINDMEIEELQKTLTTREAALEILENFLPMLNESFDIVPHPNGYGKPVDRVAIDLLPMEFNNWRSLHATANGNCLFNSASILLCGKESLCGILRLLTVAELYAHADFYGFHPQIGQFSQSSGYSPAAIFHIFLSDDSASEVYSVKHRESATLAIEVLAKTTAKPYIFSSQFHMFALASVLRMPIFSVYPDLPNAPAIKNAMHGVCYPRQSFVEDPSLKDQDSLRIMWTRASRSQLRGWSPNHFVPLIPQRDYHHEDSNHFVNFADVVKRGRKRPVQFSNTKEHRSKENVEERKPFPSKSSHVCESIGDIYSKQQDDVNHPQKLQKTEAKVFTDARNKRTMNTSTDLHQSTSFGKKQRKTSCHNRTEKQQTSAYKNYLNRSDGKTNTDENDTDVSTDKIKVCSIPKRTKLKRKSNKHITKSSASTKAAERPKISSFFKKDPPKQHQEQPIDNPSPLTTSTQVINEEEELFPLLGPGIDWYKLKGRNAVTNISRAEEKFDVSSDREDHDSTFISIGSQTGTIKENIEVLIKKLVNAGSDKQQNHLQAMISLGEHFVANGPIISTQELAGKYKQLKGIVSKRVRSSRMIRSMSKHLNIAQIYLQGEGFVIENHGKELLQLLGCLENININKANIIKDKVEQIVGDDFKVICEYLDTKRDRDTLKAILTKLTSATFMAKLANVQDKRTFQRAKQQVDHNIQLFKQMKEDVIENVDLVSETGRKKKNRLLQKMKLEKLRHVFEGRGRIMKCEEFPDLAAIMEFAFGESDRIARGGGGLESHPRLIDTVLYRATDNNTMMKDAKETVLALAPKGFDISLSSCFNYTQNFKEGTYQAKRHHAGKGINACISLHKPPRIGVEKFVVNLRWSTHNVNLTMDFAHLYANNVMIDSKDAKAKVQADVSPVQKPGRTWRKINLPDHDWSGVSHNTITPMTHLFMETKLNVEKNSEEECIFEVKKTGTAAILLNLSYFEPQTIQRAFNEIFLLMSNPALDKYFRNPATGRLKEHFIFVVDNGPAEAPSHPMVKMWLARLLVVLRLKSITQKSFAEYHSKRNPVERVHAVANRVLSNDVFSSTGVHKEYEKGDESHRENMEFMAGNVKTCLERAQYGGVPVHTQRGIGSEDNFIFNDEDQLLNFLSRSELLKSEYEGNYYPQKNGLWEDICLSCGLNEDFTGSYREDYEKLENKHDEEGEQTCWATKYSTTVVAADEDDVDDYKDYLIMQPVPDYVRWYITGGELHYIPLEKLKLLSTNVIDSTSGAFLPSKILDLACKVFKYDINSTLRSLALLSWCTEEEVERYFLEFRNKLNKSYENDKEREYWRHHDLYKTKEKAALKRECIQHKLLSEGKKHQLVKQLVEALHLPLPPPLEKYDGNTNLLPSSITDLSLLPVFKLKEILRYHNVLDCGTKDELAIRVGMVKTGNSHLAFAREYFALKNLITAAKTLIQLQKRMYILDPKITIKRRKFRTPTSPTLSNTRPRDKASVFRKNITKASISIPVDIDLETLDSIFKPINDEITLYSAAEDINNDYLLKAKSSEKAKVEAMRSVGANVLAFWSKQEIGDTGWKIGWYRAKVTEYDSTTDIAKLVFDVEANKDYSYCVNDEVKAKRLKLAKDTERKMDQYELFFQVGSIIEVRWSSDDVVESQLQHGWHTAYVQSFERDDDEISIVVSDNPEWTYPIPVLPNIMSDKIRIKQRLL